MTFIESECFHGVREVSSENCFYTVQKVFRLRCLHVLFEALEQYLCFPTSFTNSSSFELNSFTILSA